MMATTVAVDSAAQDEIVVFHGTAYSRVAGLAASLDQCADGRPLTQKSWMGLYVTDRPELARRYANAQATGEVSAEFVALTAGAAVVGIAVPADSLTWSERGLDYQGSLDAIEATIKTGRLVSVEVELPSYTISRDYFRFVDRFGAETLGLDADQYATARASFVSRFGAI